MAENSGIGWTDHTQNFWWGCHKVSAECKHCYIDGIMRRAGREPFNGPMRTVDWSKPLKWERQAQKQGRRFRVFTCSMSDFFHPGADEWRPEAWVVIRQCPSLDWLVLTKRPELIMDRLPPDWGDGYPNVWLGVTCGVASSLHRLDTLKSIPAALRWVSAEPLLGPIDFRPYLDGTFQWIASPTAGEPLRLSNRFVITLNSNEGMLSIDLMNRSLPIHLAPTSDVHEKQTAIGNPKLEFLPKFGRQIEAEFRGMIEKWKAAGSPLDNSVRHPMSNWAKTIGGILMVNGFTDFLANYGSRKSADDPLRESLAILGAAQPGKALRPDDWAKLAVTQGLSKTLFSPNERDTPKGRERNIGVILMRHIQVTFDAQTDTTVYRLRLEGGFRRWTPGKNPHTRYRFEVLSETPKSEEAVDQQDQGM